MRSRKCLLQIQVSAFAFESSDKARLPTLSHIVSGLAEIQQFEIVDARLTISKGQSDLSDPYLRFLQNISNRGLRRCSIQSVELQFIRINVGGEGVWLDSTL
jgi:hypothetical protein